MGKSVIATALIGSAAAFAPAPTSKATATALNAFESELGSQPPLGFWDPLGLLDNADQEKFDRLRYVEIKHGRISMLAFLGNIITRAGIHLGGSIDTAGELSTDPLILDGTPLTRRPSSSSAVSSSTTAVLQCWVFLDLWSTNNWVDPSPLLERCKKFRCMEECKLGSRV